MSGRVYFVARGDHIKIGFTGNLAQRLRDLENSGGPGLDFLGSMPGTRQDEQWLHRRFASSRVVGEWFHTHGMPSLLVYLAMEADLELAVAP